MVGAASSNTPNQTDRATFVSDVSSRGAGWLPSLHIFRAMGGYGDKITHGLPERETPLAGLRANAIAADGVGRIACQPFS